MKPTIGKEVGKQTHLKPNPNAQTERGREGGNEIQQDIMKKSEHWVRENQNESILCVGNVTVH